MIDQIPPIPNTFLSHSALAPILVVDLDGTLVNTDTLYECLIQLVRTKPLEIIGLPFYLLAGRAAFKRQLGKRVRLEPSLLPFNEPLVKYLRDQHAQGRRIVLATAADESVASAVSDYFGIFDAVLSSNGRNNLKGHAKLFAIKQLVGDRFSYAGDSSADLPIWASAETVLIVGATPSVARQASHGNIEWQQPRSVFQYKAWIRQLRVHQWLKNVLIFVALFTSFSFVNTSSIRNSFCAFLAFSLSASATYIANDLWDLESDRSHPSKRTRPLASGQITIQASALVAVLLLMAGLQLALYVRSEFALTLLGYILLTTAYSWSLKRVILVDVLVLAFLFTLRIVAGAIAIGVVMSAWLLEFSIFFFLSLALVKRCSELVLMQDLGRLFAKGRDYRVSDLAILMPLGSASGVAAVVVLGLFINSADVQIHYATPSLLWFVCAVMLYFVGRLWIKTARGEMHDDPLVFAATDRSCIAALAASISIVFISHSIRVG